MKGKVIKKKKDERWREKKNSKRNFKKKQIKIKRIISHTKWLKKNHKRREKEEKKKQKEKKNMSHQFFGKKPTSF